MIGDKEKNAELFATWLAQNAPSAHLSDLYLCYSEIEAYCLKTKVLRKPLFETTDLDTVKRAQKAVTESRIFQLSHKKQMKKIVAAAQYYTAFVKSLSVKETNAAAKVVPQNTPAVSLKGKLNEVTQRNESASGENKKEDNTLKVDFLHINSFAYTRPVSFSYFGDEQTDISNWTQLYVKVLVHLSEDYPDKFLRMYNKNISGGKRIDFGTQTASEEMKDPKKVSDNFYAETNLSATDIVTKIRVLLDRCNVDYENLEIYYIKLEPTNQAVNEQRENAPTPVASEVRPTTQRYASFARSTIAKKSNASETAAPQNIPSVSTGEKLSEDSQKKGNVPSKNEREDSALKVDFLHIGSFVYTRPVSFAYFGDEQAGISNWTQLYVKVLAHLSEDYPNELLRMYNTNINGGRRIDFGTQEASEKMKAPKRVSDNFYAETNLSATDIVMKIRVLLDRCNVDYENLEIYYIKLESTQQTETAPVKNAPTSLASAAKVNVPTAATGDTGNYREMFRNWLLHNQYMAEGSAQSYSSAITNCEQLAVQLGLPETRLYGVDRDTAQRVVEQLMQNSGYAEVNTTQHRRYNAAITKYLLYLRSTGQQNNIASVDSKSNGSEQHGTDFDSFFEGEKYELLYKELKKKGITTLEELKEVNLWSFMNLHQLYPIQQRLAISTELTAKLRDAGKEDNEQSTSAYEIHYNGNVYKGTSPSKAFVAFLTAIATKYPLKFRTLLNVYNPESQKIVISRRDYDNTKLKLMNPEAYVDPDLTLNQVWQYIAWIIKRCDAVPSQYTVEEKTNSVELPQRKTENPPAEKPQRVTETPAASPDLFLAQEAENYLLKCDLTGATYDELQSKLRYTMVGTKEIVAQSPHIIEMNRRLYHEEALVDFEEGADTLEAVLDKLLKKNDGIATAKHLYEYARSEMAMFFNDNDITDQQSVYDLARHLFEKLKYHGKQYVFKSNMYISLPDVSADSVIDIAKKYAGEKGSTITYKEIESYLAGLGLNTGNLRGLMRIDKEPVFLIYAENEYLLAELMHIDAAFLESVRCALRRLFADTDGHIIPRNISESWYNLLPTLPACLSWTPMLLQQLIRFYPDDLEARTIIAMESQSSNTLHAMFVEKESWIQDFRDVVAVFLHNEMPNRCEFEAEELRGILVDAGMISGNQLIYNMPNALGGDPRFIWNSEGSYVKVRI